MKYIEKSLADMLEQINRGAPTGISSKTIKTSVTGPSDWTIYESEYNVGSGAVSTSRKLSLTLDS